MKSGFSTCWLISYFNYNDKEIFSKLPTQKKEFYIDIWKGLPEEKKEGIIRSVVEQVSSYNSLCFEDNDKRLSDLDIYSPKYNCLSDSERMLKMLLHFKRLPKLKKEDIKNYLIRRLLEKKNGSEGSVFAATSISCNIKAAIDIEHFFMNLIVEKLDRLYYIKYVIEDFEEEPVNEKKKQKKRKKKKNKKKKEQKNNEESVSDDKEKDKGDSYDKVKNKVIEFELTNEDEEVKSNKSIKDQKKTIPNSLEDKKEDPLCFKDVEFNNVRKLSNESFDLGFDNQVLMDRHSSESFDKEQNSVEKNSNEEKEDKSLNNDTLNSISEEEDNDLAEFEKYIKNKSGKSSKKEEKDVIIVEPKISSLKKKPSVNHKKEIKLEEKISKNTITKTTPIKKKERFERKIIERKKETHENRKERRKQKKPKLKKITKGKKNNNDHDYRVKKELKPKKQKSELKRNSGDSGKAKTPKRKEANKVIKSIKYWKDESNSLDITPIKENGIKMANSTLLMTKNADADSEPKKRKRDRLKLKRKTNNQKNNKKREKNVERSFSKFKQEEKEIFSNPEDKKNSDGKKTEKLNDPTLNSQIRIKNAIHSVFNDQITEITDNLQSHAASLEEARLIIIDRINSIVKKTFNDNDIEIKSYGSFSTKLLTPYSDLDLSIQGCLLLEREQNIQMLQILTENLRLFSFVTKANSILTAAVPVVKLEADPSIEYQNSDVHPISVKIKVDIIVDLTDGINPMPTSLRTTNYVHYCLQNYPTFLKNMLLLKFGLNCHGLSNSYNGGLPSYALFVLYVSFIEHLNREKEECHFTLLLDFLDFIVNKFNPDKQAVYFGSSLE